MAQCADRPCRRWLPDLLVGRAWGATLDGQWHCSRACLTRSVQRRLADVRNDAGLPSIPRVRLAALLKQRGEIPVAVIDQALAAQQHSGLRLAEQLQAMGVEQEPILAALASQSGVPCLLSVDPHTVREAPGAFHPDTVRAIGLVPLSRPDKDTIRVAAAAPVQRRALNALRVVTGLLPQPYVVSDDNFAALIAQYGADGVDTSRSGFYTSDDPHATASHVAALAWRSRQVAIDDAWIDDDRRWLRVHGAGRVDDVVVASAVASFTHKETACLAATTSR
jgi:hypothetical protein